MTRRRKVLWVGDACVPSGFALATHKTVDVLKETMDVVILGINHRGDPHPYKNADGTAMEICPAYPGGDLFGIGRIVWMLDKYKPDVVVLQNDPWNIQVYIDQVRQFKEFAHIPFVGSIAVDGKNCRGHALNDLELAIFWTKFGLEEARLGGFNKTGLVIPLGVDTETYRPMDQTAARRLRGLKPEHDNVFIVGNVNRNQHRKRFDLSIRYFAEWTRSRKIDDAWLYLHVGPTGDNAYDCVQLARYYGMKDQLMLMQPEVFYGITEEAMANTYNSFDILLSTTQGEGFGLTTMEAMACGIPCVVPDWAALGEICKDAAYLVPCTSTAATLSNINVIGGIMDEKLAIEALDRMYNDRQLRADYSKLGIARAGEARYNWRNIGEQFRNALDVVG